MPNEAKYLAIVKVAKSRLRCKSNCEIKLEVNGFLEVNSVISLDDTENKATSAAESNAETINRKNTTENSKIIRMSTAVNRTKLGSGSKLKKLVKPLLVR